MATNLIANASIAINAPKAKVWDALTDPAQIRKYMFGTNVFTNWRKGSEILWKGEWKGNEYEDKGIILKIEREKLIEYSHYSPLSGKPDTPENYHRVSIELAEQDGNTLLKLTQDNNESEQERSHSESNWNMMLESIKKLLET